MTLDFKTGRMGRLARCFAAMRSWRDPFEETVVLPSLVSLVALRLADVGRLDERLAVAITVGVYLLAGAWLGAMWGLALGHRVLLSGILVGLLTSGLVAATTSIGGNAPQARALAGALVTIALSAFWAGHLPTSILRDVALMPEAQWRKGAERRLWTKDVLRMALGGKPLTEGTLPQLVATHLVWGASGMACFLLLKAATEQAVSRRPASGLAGNDRVVLERRMALAARVRAVSAALVRAHAALRA